MLLNLVFLVYFIINIRTTKQQGAILVKGESGTNITIATIEYIQNLQIFPEDNRLLRRIAYIESRDGTASDTFRDNYFGGIWQVDEAVFDATRNLSNPQLSGPNGYIDQIADVAQVDWTLVQWSSGDLLRPLLSGLAAQLFISLGEADRLSVEDVRGQARFWKESGYNTNANETVETFVDGITTLEVQGGPNHSFSPS